MFTCEGAGEAVGLLSMKPFSFLHPPSGLNEEKVYECFLAREGHLLTLLITKTLCPLRPPLPPQQGAQAVPTFLVLPVLGATGRSDPQTGPTFLGLYQAGPRLQGRHFTAAKAAPPCRPQQLYWESTKGGRTATRTTQRLQTPFQPFQGRCNGWARLAGANCPSLQTPAGPLWATAPPPSAPEHPASRREQRRRPCGPRPAVTGRSEKNVILINQQLASS